MRYSNSYIFIDIICSTRDTQRAGTNYPYGLDRGWKNISNVISFHYLFIKMFTKKKAKSEFSRHNQLITLFSFLWALIDMKFAWHKLHKITVIRIILCLDLKSPTMHLVCQMILSNHVYFQRQTNNLLPHRIRYPCKLIPLPPLPAKTSVFITRRVLKIALFRVFSLPSPPTDRLFISPHLIPKEKQ